MDLGKLSSLLKKRIVREQEYTLYNNLQYIKREYNLELTQGGDPVGIDYDRHGWERGTFAFRVLGDGVPHQSTHHSLIDLISSPYTTAAEIKARCKEAYEIQINLLKAEYGMLEN